MTSHDIFAGQVESEQVVIEIIRRRRVWERTRPWKEVGGGKGESGGNFAYVDAILPSEESTPMFRQVLDGASDVYINALIRAIVDVTTQKDPR